MTKYRIRKETYGDNSSYKIVKFFLCIDALPGYCEEGCEIDFGGYAAEQLDILEGK